MSLQSSFARAVLRPEAETPAPLTAPDERTVSTRFNVYRNNVTVSLVESLTEAFPVIAKLVGENFFTAMAREFVRDNPPTSPVMAFYGDAFPDWIADFPPAASLPYLGEVARIEQSRREAYHAADAQPFAIERLSKVPPEDLPLLRFGVHPSVRFVTTRHPALAIWARNSEAAHLIAAPAGEVLITRPYWTLILNAAPSGTIAALSTLGQGRSLGEALGDIDDAPSILATLFSSGAVIERTSNHD